MSDHDESSNLPTSKKVAAASRRCVAPSQAPDQPITFGTSNQRRAASATFPATPNQSPDNSATTPAIHIGYFDPTAPIENLSGDLPHWRQPGVTYFLTFRLSDSLPQEKLRQWQQELADWLATHPPPHDLAARCDYYQRFPQRLQEWLDAGTGCCILRFKEPRTTVEDALRHFAGQRYDLDEFVVAPNHVHAIVTPLVGNDLSAILHSWKSFTAHEIAKLNLPQAAHLTKPITSKEVAEASRLRSPKVAAASRRCVAPNQTSNHPITLGTPNQRPDASATVPAESTRTTIWQKETFDHIVRNPDSLGRFRRYIQAHRS